MTADGHSVNPQDAALLGQIRCLIDRPNVAVMRGSTSHDAWSDFCAVTDQTDRSIEVCIRHELQRPSQQG